MEIISSDVIEIEGSCKSILNDADRITDIENICNSILCKINDLNEMEDCQELIVSKIDNMIGLQIDYNSTLLQDRKMVFKLLPKIKT